MRLPRRLCLPAVWLLISLGFAGKVVGQVPDTVRPSVGIVIGHITDTAGNPVLEGEVAIARESDSLVVAVGGTNSRGIARLPRVPSGGPYTIIARKIGYKPARTTGVHIREGTTLEVSFVLQPYIALLPDVTVTADTVPRLLARHGFFGIRLFKCLLIGFGKQDAFLQVEEEICTSNRDAHAARLAAKEAAQEVQKVVRRVKKASDAGRRPNPNDALFVLTTAKACSKEVPKRPPWPRPDPDVRCRELHKRIPRDTLEHIRKVLTAINATEPFEAELRRLEEEKYHRDEEKLRQRREVWRRILDSVQSSEKSHNP